jgi:hypothetical protein
MRFVAHVHYQKYRTTNVGGSQAACIPQALAKHGGCVQKNVAGILELLQPSVCMLISKNMQKKKIKLRIP